MIPSLLLMKKAISAMKAEESLNRIVEVGHYSPQVILFACEVFSEASQKDKGNGDLQNTLLGG
jgi:hypothetical protein